MLKRILFASVFVLGICSAQTAMTRELGCTAASASGTAYTCNISPAPSALVTGTMYYFVADVANTSATTINFNSLGAKTIVQMVGGVASDLVANDIRANQYVVMRYDGSNMQMVSQVANARSRTCTFTIADPVAGDSGKFKCQVPNAATITNITCHTDTGSMATVNVNKRAAGTPATSGTDAMSSPLTCSSTPTTGTITSASITTRDWLTITNGAATSTPTVLVIAVEYR